MNLRISPLASLIAVNFIPLVGVLYWGWDLFPLLFFFWMESVVIGLFTIVKMYRLMRIMSVPFILFFLFHYGIFTGVHVVFVFAVFGPGNLKDVEIALGFVAMLVSHYNSYRQNFIGKGEYASTNIIKEMFVPYGRIMLLQVVILMGGYYLQEKGDSLIPLLLLVGLKTVLDAGLHLFEHHLKAAASVFPLGIIHKLNSNDKS